MQESNAVVSRSNGRVLASMAGTELRTEKVKVTPTLAAKWLGQNTENNRNLSTRTAEAYANEMTAGRWTLTHQGIAFNRTGELVDGQHRLRAIVMSGETITMMVTTGLALEYNSPVDQGYNRSFAHLLGKSTRWVSVVRGLILLQSGMPPGGFKNTVGLLEACAKHHSGAIDAVMSITTSARACPSGLVSMLAYAYPIDINKVSSFAAELNTGELLSKGDPALALRKWVAAGRHNVRETLLASAGATRYMLQGKPLHRISAGVTGDSHEGISNYVWLTQRRRALKVFEGTPSSELVTNKREAEPEAA